MALDRINSKPLTIEDFKPVRNNVTALCPDLRIVMDRQLEYSGAYTLIGHALEMGQFAGFQNFMGYSALSTLYQDGLMSACINTVADDMTRKWITIEREDGDIENDVDNNSIDDTVDALTELSKEYRLKETFHEAVKQTRWFGGCLIFIDTGVTGDDLMTPLTIIPENRELRAIRPRFVVIEPINVFPGDFNSLYPTRQDFYTPKWWWVLSQKIHSSRFICMVGNSAPMLLRPAYNFFGIPHAQILYDYVLHFRKARVASTRLLNRFSNTILKTEMSDIMLGGGNTEMLDRRVGLFTQERSNDGVWAIDLSEDVIVHNTPLAGVHDLVTQSFEHVAAINRTPAVKLLCMSPSGFNATGESDLINYNDHIESQQESYLRDGLRTALDIIQIHHFGQIDKSITFEFNKLSEDDESIAANVTKTKAETIAGLVDSNILSQEEARTAILQDPEIPFKGFKAEDVPESPIDDMSVNPFDEGSERVYE